MPTEMKLWRIEEKQPKPVAPDTLDCESRLEDWIRDDIGMVNNNLLVIGQQVPTEHTGAIDLLALDADANLVILELKRGKTPRAVVAQALDYASYVQTLGLSDIEGIASNSGFLNGKSLNEAFRDKFEDGLPEFVNQAHRIYIVASALDSATERIIEYLSETHGVDINAATFAYFKTPDGSEMIGRSMLLDEEVVERRAEARGGSKYYSTRPKLQAIAEENGVEDLWDKAVEAFNPIAIIQNRHWRGSNFLVQVGDGNHSFISILLIDSSKENGLAISLNYDTLSKAFNLSDAEIQDACGLSEDTPFVGTGTSTETTYFFDDDRLNKLIELLEENAPEG